jgi:16S rRNA (cytosine1402-N4)-methyltransferase
MSEIINEAANFPHDSTIVDGTLGGGGHAYELAKKLSKDGIFIGIDKDPYALKKCSEKFSNLPCTTHLIHDSFANIKNIVGIYGNGKVDFILLDLGVSSFQIDDKSRGFSFMGDGPLDMRMNTTTGITLKEKLETVNFNELSYILRSLGEVRKHRLVAKVILEAVLEKRLNTTSELANIVARVVRKKKKGHHPATKTFQALRIWLNNELNDLDSFLEFAPDLLNLDGKLSIISFHSLEDRKVKQKFQKLSHPEWDIPHNLPLTKSQMPQPFFKSPKPIKPCKNETDENNRSRSAILRVLKRIKNEIG